MGGEGFTIANALNETGIQITHYPLTYPTSLFLKGGFTIANALNEAVTHKSHTNIFHTQPLPTHPLPYQPLPTQPFPYPPSSISNFFHTRPCQWNDDASLSGRR